MGIAERYETMTPREKLDYGICRDHRDKMRDMLSLSTSVRENKFCQARAANPNSICAHCYAETNCKMHPDLARKLKRNTDFLCGYELKPEDIPVINAAYFRLESFGDLNAGKGGEIQFKNYLKICERNPWVHFAIWTKNPMVMRKVFAKGIRKPENLVIVYSSPKLNSAVSMRQMKAAYPFIDKIFTVYDSNTIKKRKVHINCGGNYCMGCLRCYHRDNGEDIINEKKK